MKPIVLKGLTDELIGEASTAVVILYTLTCSGVFIQVYSFCSDYIFVVNVVPTSPFGQESYLKPVPVKAYAMKAITIYSSNHSNPFILLI